MKSYETTDSGGRVVCKVHKMLRCAECAYIAELESEVFRLQDELAGDGVLSLSEQLSHARAEIRRLSGLEDEIEELRKLPRIIPLSQGKVSLVDPEDFVIYSKYKWYSSHGYAKRSETVDGQEQSIFLHREIMGNPEGKVIDHINGDRADNRRENLRICTHEENFLNSRPNRGKRSSKYKGVSWHKRSGKWHARTSMNRRRIHIGTFDCEKDAARAYNEKVEELFGEYAYQNFIEDDECE